MFDSLPEFPFLLNYIPVKKSWMNIRKEKTAQSAISLWQYLHSINFQKLVLQRVMGVILPLEEICKK